jgi:hypothetical protein
MSADLLRRSAEKLRSPYLCNWPDGVPTALADVLEILSYVKRSELDDVLWRQATDLARAILCEPEVTP